MTRRDRAVRLLRAIGHELRAEQVTFLAGSIAYHAFVSLLPAALLAVVVVSAVGGTGPGETIRSVLTAAVTAGAADALVAELQRASRSQGVSAVGIAVLLWGTLRVFRGLDAAFSAVYETEGANGFLDQLLDGGVVFVAVAGAVAVSWVAVDLVSTGLVRRLVVIVGLVVALLPLYYVFPDTDVGLIEVTPGTVLAAVGLAAAESGFSVYVAWSNSQPTASVVAAIVVFLTWLYLSGLIVLVGAAVNAVLSNRSADVSVEPVVGDGPRPTAPRDGSTGTTVERAVAAERVTSDAVPEPDAIERLDADGGIAVELRWDGETPDEPPASDSSGGSATAAADDRND